MSDQAAMERTGAAGRSERGSLWVVRRVILGSGLVLAGVVIAGLFLVQALFAERLAPKGPLAMDIGQPLRAPSSAAPFGTDRFGRDVLSRVIHGSRLSLGVACSSIALALLVGGVLGLVSGYFGGPLDLVASRVMDIFFSFPALFLAIAIAAFLGPGLNNAIIAIAVVYTPFFSRVVRAAALTERGREYVEAAIALGARPWTVLRRHVVRNAVSPVIVQAAVSLSYALLIEAALSYLGLGTQPPAPSWGRMLNEGRTFLETAPWISFFPGLAIMLAVLAFNLIGDGLRDIFDPRSY
jgi:peptide/nickel transport system permease protein